MKANRKYVGAKQAVSGIIEVIILTAITVSIVATFYIYYGGPDNEKSSNMETASVVGQASQNQIKLLLASGGNGYTDGYNITNDVRIFINGVKVSQYNTIIWKIGGQLFFGDTDSGSWEEGETCSEGLYTVTVTIKDLVIFNGKIKIH